MSAKRVGEGICVGGDDEGEGSIEEGAVLIVGGSFFGGPFESALSSRRLCLLTSPFPFPSATASGCIVLVVAIVVPDKQDSNKGNGDKKRRRK